MNRSFRVPLKESYLLIIIIVGILSLCMYSSFALFSLEKTTSKDIFTMRAASNIETTLKIFEYKKITVPAGSNTSVMVNVNNDTGGSIYYGVFYEMVSPSTKTDDIGIYKIDWSENATSGSITNGSILPVELLVINNSSSDITLNIGVAGSDSNELGLTDGKTLITETFNTGTEPSGDAGETKTTTTDYNFDISKTNGETITLKPGTHKLEAWGASGVYSSASPTSSHPNGYGGYASGTLTLTESLNVTLYIGGSPNSNSDVNYGGWNGGGASYAGSRYNDNGSGGGATDICLTPSSITTDSYQRYVRTSASYLSRILVAGGGGGGRSSDVASNGGYFNTSGANTYVGSLTAAGSSSGTYQSGGFGYGSSGTSTSDDNAGGGGGWYGGATNGDSYGGGGSSFVWSTDTASSVPSGYTPSTKYQMTNVVYNKGNTTMPSSTSTTGTETGHSGDGHIRITSTVKTSTVPSIDTSKITIAPNELVYFKDIVTCKDNGAGCKIVLVKASSTKNMIEDNEYDVMFVLEDNSGNRYKYTKKVYIGQTMPILSGKATTSMMEQADDTTGDDGSGIYKVSHNAISSSSSSTGSTIAATTDYRYYGNDPNNYICLEKSNGTCDDKNLYRIIGSVYEALNNSYMLKVVKATPLKDATTNVYPWNYEVDKYNNSVINNTWATITSGNYSNSLTSGSSLMRMLNSEAWWNGTTGVYYGSDDSGVITVTRDFTNYGLSSNVKKYIKLSRFYLGRYNGSGEYPSEMYNYERGTMTCDSQALYWDGYVALIYPSDYGYAAGNKCSTSVNINKYSYQENNCRKKDWLYTSTFYWTLTARGNTSSCNSFLSTDTQYAIEITSDGGIWGGDGYVAIVSVDAEIYPTFYLDKDIIITGGSGTKTDPYIISK